MPGVSISTAVRTGPSTTSIAPASTFFIVGETERGTDGQAVLVTSLNDYVTAFGGYQANKYTYQQIRTFFEEGGARAYVARATATAAVKATATLEANPSNAAGVTLTAVGKGTWANGSTGGLKVDVVNTGDASFSVQITYGGDEIYYVTGFTQLAEFVSSVNNSSILANYCTAALTTGASPTAKLESATGINAVNFQNGTDGSIASSDFTDALDMFGEELGAGCVAIPGLADGSGDGVAVWDPIVAHCVAFNRIALLSFHADQTISGAASASSGYTNADGKDEYAAFYFPWVTVPVSGVSVAIPPEGYVAAVRSKTHNATGPWVAYAGAASTAGFVNGVKTAVNRTDGDTLDASRVNAIRVVSNQVVIYGARSHSTETAQWRFITHRDLVNFIVDRCNVALEPLVFSTINGRKSIYSQIGSALQGVLEPIRLAGGLFEGFDASGRQVDSGYSIKVDDTINPLSQLESGLVKAQVGIRVSTVADKIDLTITKSNLTATLV